MVPGGADGDVGVGEDGGEDIVQAVVDEGSAVRENRTPAVTPVAAAVPADAADLLL